MSKEFEEIVLKKLDNISDELKNNNQRLVKLEEGQKDTNQRLVKLEEGQKNTNQRLVKLEEGQKDTNQRLVKLEEGQKDINQRLEKVEIGLKDTNELLMDLRQRFVVFDFEINKKIDTLFDSDSVNKENIVSLNVKNYNHDTRISNLENKDLKLIKL